ncbi:MAG: MGH1-like glycoside hydrolase domain-containing protein, partial [Planctomycetota bacterium]
MGLQPVKIDDSGFTMPVLETNNDRLDMAFRIAVGDVASNIQPYEGGMLDGKRPAVMAGLNYDRPWTRDAAINVWNACGHMIPGVARNTLLSVLDVGSGDRRIGGQYWDSIIWTTGAWNYYLYTGDTAFLQLAYRVTRNTIDRLETREMDEESNLFRGPACYGDGVAAYPDYYARAGGSSGILQWAENNPGKKVSEGYGLPMKALSTNCLYYNCYKVLNRMEETLDIGADVDWTRKAKELKTAINRHFWDEEEGRYHYLADSPVNSDHQEGLGHSFAIMFGVADRERRERIFRNQHVAKAGIPCVWPTYERYKKSADAYGRHSGTVWPHVQGFWATAASSCERVDIFEHELFALAKNAVRDMQFVEIYHPDTCRQYGGYQENGDRIRMTEATNRQTWSATAFLRMVVQGLAGLQFNENGVELSPCVPSRLSSIRLSNLRFRNMVLDISINGNGTEIGSVEVNGAQRDGVIPYGEEGQL